MAEESAGENGDQRASTSTAGQAEWREWAKSAIRAAKENPKFDEIQRKIEKIAQNGAELLRRLRQRGEEAIQCDLVQRRLDKWRQGWQRVIAIYPYWDNPLGRHSSLVVPTFEWQMIKFGACTAFFVGFFFGGSFTVPESVRRYELYAVGKDMGSVGHVRRRKMDYVISRYFTRGLRKGLTLGTLMGGLLLFTFGLTAYRDRYAVWYFPVGSVSLVSAITYYRGAGLIGLIWAWTVASVPSLLLTLGTYAGCLYAGTSVADGYKQLRDQFRREAEEEAEQNAELQRYIASKGYIIRPYARMRMEEEKRMGTWRGAREGQYEQELVEFAERGDDPVDEPKR